MSEELREALIESAYDRKIKIKDVFRSAKGCISVGSWDLLTYSYLQSFDELWDQAKKSQSGLLNPPLLMLWRQSIELSLKSAIIETAGEIKTTGGDAHNLSKLFQELLEVREAVGCGLDGGNEDTSLIIEMLKSIQEFDNRSDRFRYPTTKSNKPHSGISVDLDRLYQMHYVITTWTEVAVLEAEAFHGRAS